MKNLKNLGTVLSKTEQKTINGGFFIESGKCSNNCESRTFGIGNTSCNGGIDQWGNRGYCRPCGNGIKECVILPPA